MVVAQVMYPGSWLSLEPSRLRFEVQNLLDLMVGSIGDAAIALTDFEAARIANREAPDHAQLDRFRDAAREAIRREMGEPMTFDACEAESRLVDQRALMLGVEQGVVPRSYLHRRLFIHAKTYLYALDSIAKALGALGRTAGLPGEIGQAIKAWDSAFPNVKEIRDSAHHLEDRVRGLGRHGQPLQLKPVHSAGMSVPSGALITDHLTGNSFGTTTSAGEFAEVEVSTDSLRTALKIVQSVLGAFTWTGPPRLEPSL